MRNKLYGVLAALLILTLSLAMACSSGSSKASLSAATPTPAASGGVVAPASSSTTSPSWSSSAGSLSSGVRDVAHKVKPAVVQITNEQVSFDQFSQPTVPVGVGSGVIYDDKGHILTNNHVVAGAQKLVVSLPDGRSFPANLVGADSQTDLAVVQISGSNLPVAQLGDSSQLQVGDWVVAIGNALALPGGPTVTAGVISALGRTVQEPADQSDKAGPFLFDVIQTDAPINPGNSGGPLVNLQGQVIGINTLVAGQAEPGVQAQGIGFAIAIATAKPIADQLVSSGHAVHPYLGISYVPLSPSLAAQLGTNEKKGDVVAQVASGSPAEKAGLQTRDVITAIDGAQVQDESTLARVLNQHQPGDTVTLTVDRGDKISDVKVTLGEMPS